MQQSNNGLKPFYKRYFPTKYQLKSYKSLRWIGHQLYDPVLWKWQRKRVAKAAAIGLFFAFIPLPAQMLLAAICAVYFRANLPLSIMLVWISNPLTMPPIFYFCYVVGGRLLQQPIQFNEPTLSEYLMNIWQPFMLGCVVLASCGALIGYVVVMVGWRFFKKKHR